MASKVKRKDVVYKSFEQMEAELLPRRISSKERSAGNYFIDEIAICLADRSFNDVLLKHGK